jgi:hypothetical protein
VTYPLASKSDVPFRRGPSKELLLEAGNGLSYNFRESLPKTYLDAHNVVKNLQVIKLKEH